MAMCQLDTVVGDIDGNLSMVLAAMEQAEREDADVVCFPELAVTGYPPEDLLLKPAFVADNLAALHEVAARSGDALVVVGFVDVIGPGGVGAAVDPDPGGRRESVVRGAPRRLRNAAGVCNRGRVVGVYHKRLLPNYGVFDEERWFGAGTSAMQLYEVAGVPVGVSICEDLWFDGGPITEQAAAGARVVVNLNASPYNTGRHLERVEVLRARVAEAGCAIVYVNQVGGQDELVFDGGSMVVGAGGEVLAAAPQFEPALLCLDVEPPPGAPATLEMPTVAVSEGPRRAQPTVTPPMPPSLSTEAEVYQALVLGTRDYVAKNGFEEVLLGMSGGIDSSLVAVVAADALGPARVHALSMPSRYSSDGSRTDALELAEALGIDLRVVSIEPAHKTMLELIASATGAPVAGMTEENLQSRIRGVLLMAVSNANGWLVLTTGNKSEMATGYSTLYGDSAGGFAVIRDVPKTLVYRLCRYRNDLAGKPLIPEAVLTKAPSAELRPGQRDDQSLPPYEVLDPILEGLVTLDRSIAELQAQGFDPEVVTRVARLVDTAEYKRRQSPPGIRITSRAFGKDRRMPITNRYRDRSYDDRDPGGG